MAGGLALAGLVAAPAAAGSPTRETLVYQLESPGAIDCGAFVDNFVDYYDIREIDTYDAAGTLVDVRYHVEHHSNDVNSVTGLTIHEHGHFYERDDLVAGTYTLSGSQEVANRPGTGVVVQDTGHMVLDADFNLVFFAGGRAHSEWLIGDEVLCAALG